MNEIYRVRSFGGLTVKESSKKDQNDESEKCKEEREKEREKKREREEAERAATQNSIHVFPRRNIKLYFVSRDERWHYDRSSHRKYPRPFLCTSQPVSSSLQFIFNNIVISAVPYRTLHIVTLYMKLIVCLFVCLNLIQIHISEPILTL